jgi:4-hydroxybenzoate polyprenyltransferase
MRPKQWTKNVFVFAGVFFDGRFLDPTRLLRSTLAFVLFCLVSGAIYLINDLVDVDRDRMHPTKRHRPLASGALSVRVAWVAAFVILAATFTGAFWLNTSFGLVTLFYALVMVLYSFVLKHVVIVDVMTIAAGFVLRVFAGTTVVQVTRFSPWLYVCTTLLALFIALNKRRHELVLLADQAESHRSILQEYTLSFLDDMTALVTATALGAYSFYTFSAPNVPTNHSMMLTIPFVMYGLFRYMYLIHARNMGGAPEDILLGDRPLLIAIILWGLTAGLVIYTPLLLR